MTVDKKDVVKDIRFCKDLMDRLLKMQAIKRYEKHSKCINQTLITKEEAESVHELLRKLKAYENIIFEITEAMDCYDGCEKAQGFREYPTNDFIDDVRKCVEQFEEVKADE